MTRFDDRQSQMHVLAFPVLGSRGSRARRSARVRHEVRPSRRHAIGDLSLRSAPARSLSGVTAFVRRGEGYARAEPSAARLEDDAKPLYEIFATYAVVRALGSRQYAQTGVDHTKDLARRVRAFAGSASTRGPPGRSGLTVYGLEATATCA